MKKTRLLSFAQKCSLTMNLYHSYLSGAPTHILDNPHFYPRVTSILCKSELCVVLHLRANYILVSFSEYHPDKHYTWLPFPAAQCNPSLHKKKRKRDTETERGVKRERKKKREEFKRGKSLHRSKRKKKKTYLSKCGTEHRSHKKNRLFQT